MTAEIVKFAGSDPKTSSPAIAEAMRWGRRTRFNPVSGLSPQTLTRALESFDRGDLREGALLWEAIASRDDTIPSVKAKREKSVAHKPLETVALEKSAAAEAHREVLEAFWKNVRYVNAWDRSDAGGVQKLIRSMQSAVSYRYATHHIVWRPTRDGLRATFEAVPLWFFEAREARLRFLPSGYGLEGAELDPREWLVSYGDGLMFAASIGYYCKRATLQDWLRFSEKFAMPGVLGKTSAAQGTAEGEAMRSAVETFGNEWAAVLYGFDGANTAGIELIQANGNPAAMPMPALIERVDRKIAALYRGADLSTMSAGGGEGSGASLQGEEGDILERADAAERSEELQRVERTVIAWHFGEGVEPLAQTRLIVPEREDQRLLLEATKTFVEMGARLSVQDALGRFGLSEAAEDEVALGVSSSKFQVSRSDGGDAAANAWPDDIGPRLAEKITAILIEGLDEALDGEDVDGGGEPNAYDPTWPRTPKGRTGGGRWSGKSSGENNEPEYLGNDERTSENDRQAARPGRPPEGVARAAAADVLGGEARSGSESFAETADRHRREKAALDALRQARPDLVIRPGLAARINEGAESVVHDDGARVLKEAKGYGFTLETDYEIDPATHAYVPVLSFREATPTEFLDRIDAHNALWNDDIKVEGLSERGFAFSQPYYKGRHPVAAEMRAFLTDAGFRPVGAASISRNARHIQDKTWISDTGVILSDVKPDNFIRTDDGETHPIDLFIVRSPESIGWPADARIAAGNTATTDAIWKDPATSGGDRYPSILTAPNAAAVSPDADGWYQIAPYGEYLTVDGRYIQVFGREQAEAMVRHYNSLPFRITRWLTNRQVPVFIGHPDVDRKTWSDERQLATKHRRLEAREDGLWGQAKWNALGRDNLENGYWQYPSPVWLFPKPKPGTNRVFPDLLQSVGLTNFQNIPDAKRVTHNSADPGTQPTIEDDTMNPELIAELGLEEGATAEDCLAAVRALKQSVSADQEKAATAESEVAAANAARETAEAALSAHRESAANALLDAAVEGGAITLAERKGWAHRFATDYEAAANALAEVKPTPGLNTKAVNLGEKPAAAPATARDRIAAVNAAVAAYQASHPGVDYDNAHAAVRKDPAMKPIFDAMNSTAEES